jgi:hypothetical protein
MVTDGEKLRGLREFFTEAFSAEELTTFLTESGYGEAAAAVNQNVGMIEYSAKVAQALQRRGLIDDVFFEQMKEERPGKWKPIHDLQRLWAGREMTQGGPPAAPHPTPVAPTGGMIETAGPRRTEVFLSYSQADAAWLKRPKFFLERFRLRDTVRGWTDHQVKPGDEWSPEIQQALDAAAAAVLLISGNFLASGCVGSVELPAILQAQEERGLVVLPVYLSAWTVSEYPELAQFQALNSPERLLCDMTEREQEALWVRMSQAIQRAVGPVPAGSASVWVSALGRDDRPAIYLAPAATATLSAFRDEVQDYLALQLPGVRILPESSDPGGPVAAAVSAVQADLRRSALFVQLLDLSRGLNWFDDAREESSVALWHRCAVDLKAPREILQWRDARGPLPKAADSPHGQLLEGPTVSIAFREEFKGMIVERYGELTAPAPAAPAGEPELGEENWKQIFIDAEPTPGWLSVANRIAEELKRKRIGFMLPKKGLETKKRRETRDSCLTDCAGLLFVGGSNPGWLMEELEAYRKVQPKRKKKGKSLSVPMALCEGPPEPGPCEGPLVSCFWCDPEARRGASVTVRRWIPGFVVIDCSAGVCTEASGCRGGSCVEAFEQFVRRVREGGAGAEPQSQGGPKP